MPTNEDIAQLIATVAEADEVIAEAHKLTDIAMNYMPNKLMFWRYRKLRKAKADLAEQEKNLSIAKRYINDVMRGNPTEF